MNEDRDLMAKLAKMEALFRSAGGPGEKSAAGAVIKRLQRAPGEFGRATGA
ncbi:MAG: hypothetical protein OXH76_17660 [Boseongicola sp.]|nr:hypothetical protein [Boseongicola sp.]